MNLQTSDRSEQYRTAEIDDLESPWCAVQVWAGKEAFCSAQLQARQYEVLLPRYIERRRWSDRVKSIEKALFPGYLFCRIDAAVTGKVVTIPGVIRIIGDGRDPLPIPRHEIEAIRSVMNVGLEFEPWRSFYTGQRVRLVAGPLCGVEGVVVRIKNKHRLVVSVTVLQRSVAVEVDPDWVDTADRP